MIAKLTVAVVAAGMLGAGGVSTALAAPAAQTVSMPLAAFSTPLDFGRGNRSGDGDGGRDGDHRQGRDQNDRRDGDHGRGWDGDRRRDNDWDGHDWHWWHDSGISPDLCRDGGGHVRWDRHRCDGGRFDGFRVR